MGKILKNVLFIIYIVIAVLVTICLLSYNEMKTTQFGNYSLVIVDSNKWGDDYNKGDLLIVDNSEEILAGETAIFYSRSDRRINLNMAKVEKVEYVNENENTYTFEGDVKISSQYVLGSTRTTNSIPKLGTILGVLESKWGFLFLIVLPALILFLYQVMVVISQIKESRTDDQKE